MCLDQCFTSSADNEPKTCQQCLESGCVPTAAMVRSRKYTHGEEVKERERDEKATRRETRDERRGMKARDESEGEGDGERV